MRKKLYLIISLLMTVLFNMIATDSLNISAESSSEFVLLMGIDPGMPVGEENHNIKEKELEGSIEIGAIGIINSEDGDLTLIRIPSDELFNGEDSINSLYQKQNAESVMQSLNEHFDLNITDYLLFNLEGMQEIVDILGGIEVEPPVSFENNQYRFIEDEPTILDGEEAVAYRRPYSEHNDPTYSQRQEQLIMGLIEKISKEGDSLDVTTLLTTLSDYTDTSYNIFQLMSLGNRIGEYIPNASVYQLEANDMDTKNTQIVHELIQLGE